MFTLRTQHNREYDAIFMQKKCIWRTGRLARTAKHTFRQGLPVPVYWYIPSPVKHRTSWVPYLPLTLHFIMSQLQLSILTAGSTSLGYRYLIAGTDTGECLVQCRLFWTQKHEKTAMIFKLHSLSSSVSISIS